MTDLRNADLSSAASQQQFLDVIDREEAQRRFHRALAGTATVSPPDTGLAPLAPETIPLNVSLHRVLAQDIVSVVNVPSFDRSNVDGFAVLASDTYGATETQPIRLDLDDEALATGRIPESEIQSGRAITIATGGMLPRGADAVVMVEQTELDGDQLLVHRAVTPGSRIAHAGTDIAVGETILRAGQVLTSRETGVLAAIGKDQVTVWRQVRVAILSTGDEIIPPDQAMRPPLVYDSNAQILADAVSELGGLPIRLGIVKDEAVVLRRALQEAIAQADVVLLSGGTSKGAGDIAYRVVDELTDPGIVAHGVALKPGKPVCLAVTAGKPVVVLPGFPTSAIFTFHEFVAPLITALGGRRPSRRPTVEAELAVRVNSEIGRTEYLLVGLVEAATAREKIDGDRVGLKKGDENIPRLAAYPMGTGSGAVTTFSVADGFIAIARRCERLQAGSLVRVQLLGAGIEVADLVVIGSHCVGLDWLLGQLHRQGFRTKFLAVGSTAGLAAAQRGQCDLAGIHLLDAETGQYNESFVTDELDLIEGYRRLQGIVFRRGDARFEGLDAEECVRRAVAEPDCRMVNRNHGSGTRILIDRQLAGNQPLGYTLQVRSHHAVAAAVAQRRADWGVAIQSVVGSDNLGFAPLCNEKFDFAGPKTRSRRPAVLALKKLLADPVVRRELDLRVAGSG